MRTFSNPIYIPMHAVFVLLCVGFQGSLGYIHAVDDVRPWIVSGGKPVSWAYLAASARVLRVNYRGIHVRDQPSMILRGLVSLGWTRTACNVSAFGLCSSELGHVFPGASPQVSDDPWKMLVGVWSTLDCARSEGKEIVSRGVYDISACDILDENLDIVVAGGDLYFSRESEVHSWKYWTLVIMSIVLVRGLGFNVQRLAGGQTQAQWTVLIASVIVWLLVVLDDTGMYVTQEDFVFVCATETYILVYLGYHLCNWVYKIDERDDPPIFNLITGSLQLMVCRLYVSAETPYNPVLLVLLITRVWIKIFRDSLWHHVTLVLDALYLSLYFELGFMYDKIYLVAIGLIGYIGGELLVIT